jgi:hypothetical protein
MAPANHANNFALQLFLRAFLPRHKLTRRDVLVRWVVALAREVQTDEEGCMREAYLLA